MSSEMTYIRCPACRGDLIVAGRDCPCKRSPTPGWSPTGVTVGQIDRWAEQERAIAGDPGLTPQRRAAVLDDLAVRIDRAEVAEQRAVMATE